MTRARAAVRPTDPERIEPIQQRILRGLDTLALDSTPPDRAASPSMDSMHASPTASIQHGSVVTIQGPPGVGKTHTIEALVADPGRHVIVAAVGAARSEVGLHLGVFRRLVDQLGHALRSLGDKLTPQVDLDGPLANEHTRVDAAGAVDWTMFDATERWLTELSEIRPIRLFVDDAQWADQASLQLLNYLARRVPGTELSIVCGIRVESDPSDEIIELQRTADDVRVPGPLDIDAIRSIVASHISSPLDDRIIDELATRTDRNALLVTEVTRAIATLLQQTGRDASTIAVEDLDDVGTGAVGAAVSARLRTASADALVVAHVASTLGAGAALDIVRRVARLDRTQMAVAVGELVALALLTDDAKRVEFVHALVGDAVLRRVAPVERSEHHAVAARSMIELGRPARGAARHLCEIDEDDRAELSDHLAALDVNGILSQAMAEAGAAGDSDEVVRFARHLLTMPLDDTERLSVLLTMIPPVRLRRRAEASSLIYDAIALTGNDADRARLVYDATALDKTVDPVNSRRAVLDALTDLDTGLDRANRDHADLVARLDANLILVDLVDPEGRVDPPASVLADRARVLGGELAIDADRLRAAVLSYRTALEGGDRGICVRLAEAALGDGIDAGLDQQSIEAWTLAMATLAAADDPSLARRTEQWAHAAAQTTSLPLLAAASAARSKLALAHGALDQASQSALAAIERADAYGLDDSSTGRLYRSLLCESYYTAGRFSDARRAVEGMALTGAATDLHGPLPWLVMLRTIDDPLGAWDDALAYGRRCERLGWNSTMFLPWRSTLAAIGATTNIDPNYTGPDLRTAAWEFGAAEIEAAEHWGSPRAIARAHRYVGAMLDPDEAIGHLDIAVDAVAGTPFQYDIASSHMIRGFTLMGLDDMQVAGEALQRAIDEFDEIGGARYSQMCRVAMSVIGVKPRRAKTTGASALTKREHKVGEATTRGLTNQEIADELFISVRTVEYHLSNAYKKLGVVGRTDLAKVLTPRSS